ncbi:TetR/AcrR family transcriptional regulator [Kurthia huakuii]|uniref:TetR/AcrR family transcriptional regulator n=1 Tax=Kurthia huakuii TaxID=1421019 RepID=UPI00049557B8|nr:TetR/AcrR family transcriptional regulator [Kurthia huakuii]MBM7698446.1 AcrR family transcriptional regulator [Kurthia huakuii]
MMSKKELILQKSKELFSTKGIEQTSIEDITKACKISKGAFYLSFKSKDELLLAIVDSIIRDVIVYIQQLNDEDISSHERLERYCAYNFSVLEQHAPLVIMYLQNQPAAMNDVLFEHISQFGLQIEKYVLTFLEDSYPMVPAEKVYDLSIYFNGLIKGFGEFFFNKRIPYQFSVVAAHIMQCLDQLASASLPVFVTEELYENNRQSPFHFKPAEMIAIELEEIERCLKLYDDHAFYNETLVILKEELQRDEPRKALLAGMSTILMQENELQWLATLIKQTL